MPDNNRIYWAHQAIGVAPLGSNAYTAIHGLQSAGIDLSFTLEDILEMGQLEIYESKETVPEVEVTLEKVLDGYPLIYHLATEGATADTLAGRQNQRCHVALSIFGDTASSASGVPLKEIELSGLYYSSLNYNFSTDGPFTESVTLVGNNLAIRTSGFKFTGTIFDNTDVPLATTSGLGGVQTRQNLVWDTTTVSRDTNGMVNTSTATILPPDVYGISSSGTNNTTAGVRTAHIQSISVSMDAGRETIDELGRQGPYYRYITFPTEVTCEITAISTLAHNVTASETATNNLTNRTIKIYSQDGTYINLGTKNKLQRVSISGGGTDGGNQTITYSYRNMNSLQVSHPQDPSF